VGWLTKVSEKKMMQGARIANVELRPMSMYCVDAPKREAVLFGFAPFNAEVTRDAVARLRRSLRSL
jgi:hypothetical protein